MSNRQTKNRGRTRTETRASRRPRAGALITAGVIAGLTSVPALAGPQGERVVHGRADFQRQGSHTSISTSHKAIINYDSFNLNASESVRFYQPSRSSRVLNRITGVQPTSINGSVTANGGVYFVNPSGIMFGPNAVLNVGTLYAAAGNITNSDFLSNVNRFTDLRGDVINRGTIMASQEAHLIGRHVANFGSVVAPNGVITMTAGDDVLIGQEGGRVFARLEGGVAQGVRGSVENHGVIDAGNGQVLAGVGDHFALALYDTSAIKGSSVRIVGSRNSNVRVGGTIDASSATGRGGEIDVLGNTVALDGATLDASGATGGGQIHIGGDYQGKGDRLESRATLVTEDSSIRVDATRSGDAGRAIVWSDGATFFHGDLSAKGARKGGFAEVSGKDYLELRGSFDLRGPGGTGTLLLDPSHIWIVDDYIPTQITTPTSGQLADFASADLDTTLMLTQVADQDLNTLLSTADVELRAQNDVLFFQDVMVDGSGNSLTIEAGRSILLLPNAQLTNLTDFNATVNFFDAGITRLTGQGSFAMLSGASVDVSGGFNVTVGGEVGGNYQPGDIAILGELSAGSLTLRANTTEGVAGGRILMLNTNAGTDHPGFGATLDAQAADGVYFLDHAGAWTFNGATIASPNVYFDADATGIDAGAGALDFNPFDPDGAGGVPAVDSTISTSNAAFTFGGAGGIGLGADIDAAGSVSFDDAVVLTDGARTIDAFGVTFNGALDSEAGEQNDLTLTLHGEDADFNQAVGASDALGDLVIEDAAGSTIAFGSSLSADSLLVGAGGSEAASLTLGETTLGGSIAGDATRGLDVFAATTTINGFTRTETAGMRITGSLSLNNGLRSAGDVEIVGDTTIASDPTITVDGASTLTFDGEVQGTSNLTINMGTGGVTFTGLVGTLADPLGDITITGTGSAALDFQQLVRAAMLDASGFGTVDLDAGAFIGGLLAIDAGTINIGADANAGTEIDLTFSAALNAGILNAPLVSVEALGTDLLFDFATNLGDSVTDLRLTTTGTGSITLTDSNGDDVNLRTGFDDVEFVRVTSAEDIQLTNVTNWLFRDLRMTAGTDIVFDAAAALVDWEDTLDANLAFDTGTGVIQTLGAAFTFGDSAHAASATTWVLADDITASGDLTIHPALVLTGPAAGSTRTITLLNGGQLVFEDAVDSAANEATNLTIDLGGGGAMFNGAVGLAANGRLGLIQVDNLSGTLAFLESVNAAALTSNDGDGDGDVQLGDSGADQFDFNGQNANGNSLELVVSNNTIDIHGDLTLGFNALLGSNVVLFGDNAGDQRSITMTSGDLTFAGTVNSDAGDGIGLSLTLNGNNAEFQQAVGDVGALGAISVTGAGGTLDFGSTIDALSLTANMGAGDIILRGVTTLTDTGTALDLTAGPSTIDLFADLFLSGDAFFRTDVELFNPIAISMLDGASLRFDGEVNTAAAAGADANLTITLAAGGNPDGNVTFNGLLGNDRRLGTLDISGDIGTVTLAQNTFLDTLLIGRQADASMSPANIVIGSTIDADTTIELGYTQSLTMGVLNAPLIQIMGHGADLIFDFSRNLGADVDDLRLSTDISGRILLRSQDSATVNLRPAGFGGVDVAEVRIDSADDVVFLDATNWLFRGLSVMAAEDIAFEPNAALLDWENAIGGPGTLALDADSDDNGTGRIVITSGAFTIGDTTYANTTTEFVLADDISASNSLTINPATFLMGNALGQTRRIDILNGGTLDFTGTLDGMGGVVNLDIALINGGGVAFRDDVGQTLALGDVALLYDTAPGNEIDGLTGELRIEESFSAESLTSISGDGDIFLGFGDDADNPGQRDEILLTGANANGNALELLAADTTINLHGNMTLGADGLFGSNVVLFGGGQRSITMTGANAQLAFNGTVLADSATGLVLDLQNGSDATFMMQLGDAGAGVLGSFDAMDTTNSAGSTLTLHGDLFLSGDSSTDADVTTVLEENISIAMSRSASLTFDGAINSASGEGNDLLITTSRALPADPAGDVTFSGLIGNDTDLRLGTLSVTGAAAGDLGTVAFTSSVGAPAYDVHVDTLIVGSLTDADISPENIVVAGRIDADTAIEFGYTQSLTMGLLNAPLVRLVGHGADLIYDFSRNLGADVTDLRLTTLGSGRIFLRSQDSADVNLRPAGFGGEDVADVRVISADDILFMDATNWMFRNAAFSAAQDIVFLPTTSLVDWEASLNGAGTPVFDADTDTGDAVNGRIISLSADLRLGDMGYANTAAEFVIADNVLAAGNLTVNPATLLRGNHLGQTRRFDILGGGTLEFLSTLDSMGGTVSLDIALISGGSAIFRDDVGENSPLGDITLLFDTTPGNQIDGVTGELRFDESLFAESLTSLSGTGDVILGAGADADNAALRDQIGLTGGNGNLGANGIQNSLELLASNSTIHIGGDITLALNGWFGSNVELEGVNDGEQRRITMLGNGTTLTFDGDVLSNGTAAPGVGVGIGLDLQLGGGAVYNPVNTSTATFNGMVGDNGTGRLGVIDAHGAGSTLEFFRDVYAAALFAGDADNPGGDSGALARLELGQAGYLAPWAPGTTQSIANFDGAGNGDGFSLDVFADDVRINANTEASGAGIRLNGPVMLRGDLVSSFATGDVYIRDHIDVYGDRLISSVGGEIRIDSTDGRVPVVLMANDVIDDANPDTTLTVATDTGDMFFASIGGESVQRNGTGFLAQFQARSNEGNLDIASIGETLFNDPMTAGFLDLINIHLDFDGNMVMGTSTLRGNRYLADVITMHAGAHNIDHDEGETIFGDILVNLEDLNDPGNTNRVLIVEITGGSLNLDVDTGSVQLNAMNALGGDITLFGATTPGADDSLFINAFRMATVADGGLIGSDGVTPNPFGYVEIQAADADINGGIFADILFLNPTNDILEFNGDEAGVNGMLIDAADVANLNLGAIETLLMAHGTAAQLRGRGVLPIDTASEYAARDDGLGNNPAIYVFGAGTGGIPLMVGGTIDFYGNTFFDGVFESTLMAGDAPGSLNFYGPTTFRDDSGLNVSFLDRGVFFYDMLTVGTGTSITTQNGDLTMVNADPDGAGNTVDGNAEIVGVGGELTVNLNGGVATLYDVGMIGDPDIAADDLLLNLFDVTASQINFNGEQYGAFVQNYTADVYQMNGKAGGPASVTLVGNTVDYNDAGGVTNQIQLMPGIDLIARLRENGGNAGRFTSNAFVLGGRDQLVDILVTGDGGLIELNRAMGWDGNGDVAAANQAGFIGSAVLSADNIVAASVLSAGTQSYTAGTGINLIGDRYHTDSAAGDAIVFVSPLVSLNPANGTTSISTADGGTVGFDVDRIVGNNNALDVNTGSGTIDYKAGIIITNAAQSYTADEYNFLGSATIINNNPIAAIAFNGGTLNMGGDFLARTHGADSSITLGDLVNLNGNTLRAFALGDGSDVTVPVLAGLGTETVRLAADGLVSILGTNAAGVALLDIDANLLEVNGPTAADMVTVATLDPARDISVGVNRFATLNISNTDLGNLAYADILIGQGNYAGTIFVDNAQLHDAVQMRAQAAGGEIRFLYAGVQGTTLTSLDALTNRILLAADIVSAGGAFGTTLAGPIDVAGVSNIATNGGDLLIVDPINGLTEGAGDLAIDSAGGLITLPVNGTSVIGADRRLASFSVVGSPTLTLAGVRTADDQTFMVTPGGLITMRDGATFDATGSDAVVALNGDSSLFGDVAFRTANLFLAGDLTRAGAAATSISVTANDGVSRNASVFSGDIVMDASTVELFTDTVADAAGASLTINGAASTIIDGSLGSTDARLNTFTSSEIGLTELNDASILTVDRATFRNAVRVTGDNVVFSSGDTADAGILFESTITGGSSLSLIINRDTGADTIGSAASGTLRPADAPFIELRGDIGEFNADGTPVASSLDLFLNFVTNDAGNEVIRRNIPINATIVLGNTEMFNPGLGLAAQPTVNVNVNEFVMGANEKLLALGNLNLVGSGAGARARLGDVTALGNLNVNFPSVSFFQRQPGEVFDPSSGTLLPDQGTDVVAGGEMTIGTVTALEGTGNAPEFAQPNGDPTIDAPGFFFLFKFLNAGGGNLGSIVFSNGVFVDARADGISNTNVAEVIAGAAPREGQSEPITTDTGLSQAAVDLLNNLQLEIKQPNEPSYLVDMPEIGSEGVVKVSNRRLEPELVTNLIDTYRSTFLVEAVGEDGEVATQSRRTEIQTTLSEAASASGQELDSFDPDAFMNYLRQDPGANAEALATIEQLQDVVAAAKILGLTKFEIVQVKSAIVADAAPLDDIPLDAFRDLIEPDQALLLGVR